MFCPFVLKRMPPRTPGVIIYLQGEPCPLLGSFPLQELPYQNLGFSLVGFTRSTLSISGKTRLCGTFIGTHTMPEGLGVFPAVSVIDASLTYGFIRHEHYRHLSLCEHGLSSPEWARLPRYSIIHYNFF